MELKERLATPFEAARLDDRDDLGAELTFAGEFGGRRLYVHNDRSKPVWVRVQGGSAVEVEVEDPGTATQERYLYVVPDELASRIRGLKGDAEAALAGLSGLVLIDDADGPKGRTRAFIIAPSGPWRRGVFELTDKDGQIASVKVLDGKAALARIAAGPTIVDATREEAAKAGEKLSEQIRFRPGIGNIAEWRVREPSGVVRTRWYRFRG